jgi:hypothetical protein
MENIETLCLPFEGPQDPVTFLRIYKIPFLSTLTGHLKCHTFFSTQMLCRSECEQSSLDLLGFGRQFCRAQTGLVKKVINWGCSDLLIKTKRKQGLFDESAEHDIISIRFMRNRLIFQISVDKDCSKLGPFKTFGVIIASPRPYGGSKNESL